MRCPVQGAPPRAGEVVCRARGGALKPLRDSARAEPGDGGEEFGRSGAGRGGRAEVHEVRLRVLRRAEVGLLNFVENEDFVEELGVIRT